MHIHLWDGGHLAIVNPFLSYRYISNQKRKRCINVILLIWKILINLKTPTAETNWENRPFTYSQPNIHYSVYLFIFIYLCINLSILIYLSIYLFIYLSIHIYLYNTYIISISICTTIFLFLLYIHLNISTYI